MTQNDARREVFETAAALADALMDPVGPWSWEPLRGVWAAEETSMRTAASR
jgi:hypothetical protein